MKMFRKMMTVFLAILAISSVSLAASGPLIPYKFGVMTDLGEKSTATITATVYTAGTAATAATVYSSPSGTAIGTTLTSVTTGVFEFWGSAYYYDVMLTDGTASVKYLNLTPSTGHLVMPVMQRRVIGNTFDVLLTSLTAADYGFSSIVTQTAGSSDGIAFYAEAHIAGTATGYSVGSGIWLNIDSAAVTGAREVVGLDVGVYESGATMTSTAVYPLKVQGYFDSTNGPTEFAQIKFNCDQAGTLPDHWFFADNPESVCYTAGTGTSGTKVGTIKVYIRPDGDRYLRLYDSAS